MSLRITISGSRETSPVHGRAGAVLTICLAAVVCCLGGCAQDFNGGGGSGPQPIYGTREFQRTVLWSDRPVLVEFYKDNCPTCVVQEGVLGELQAVYGSRVSFTKYKIRDVTMAASSPEIMDRYKLFWVPTVILFVNGQERQRWVFNHTAAEFQPALNEALAEKAKEPEQPSWLGSFGAEPSTPAAGGSGAVCRPGEGCAVVRVP